MLSLKWIPKWNRFRYNFSMFHSICSIYIYIYTFFLKIIIDFFLFLFSLCSYRFSALWQQAVTPTTTQSTYRTLLHTQREIDAKQQWKKTIINKRTPSIQGMKTIESKPYALTCISIWCMYWDPTHKFTARVFISTAYRFLLNSHHYYWIASK